jgi:WhiB family redox-sensing transcriptional regulator
LTNWLDLDALEALPDVTFADPGEDSMLPIWRQRAACRDAEEVMFDEGPAASALCATCPVAVTCLHYALDTESSWGTWAGTTWEERVLICPICLGPKPADQLGCNFAHTLHRLARLCEQQAAGDWDVRVSTRTQPSARTNRDCVLPRGHSHSTAASYKAGCRCQAAVDDLRAQRRELRGDAGAGVAYRKERATS